MTRVWVILKNRKINGTEVNDKAQQNTITQTVAIFIEIVLNMKNLSNSLISNFCEQYRLYVIWKWTVRDCYWMANPLKSHRKKHQFLRRYILWICTSFCFISVALSLFGGIEWSFYPYSLGLPHFHCYNRPSEVILRDPEGWNRILPKQIKHEASTIREMYSNNLLFPTNVPLH